MEKTNNDTIELARDRGPTRARIEAEARQAEQIRQSRERMEAAKQRAERMRLNQTEVLPGKRMKDLSKSQLRDLVRIERTRRVELERALSLANGIEDSQQSLIARLQEEREELRDRVCLYAERRMVALSTRIGRWVRLLFDHGKRG